MKVKKKYILKILPVFLISGLAIHVATTDDIEDVCSLKPHSGACSTILLAWFYDPVEEQCREFIYGGCGGNGNRFPSEEECYKKCREQLMKLRPPESVNIPFTLTDKIYLYWLPPENYKIHDPTNETHTIVVDENGNTVLTSVGSGVTHKVIALPDTTLTPSVKPDDSTKPQQNSSKLSDNKDGGNKEDTGVGEPNRNNTDYNSTASDTKDSPPGDDSAANVTESVEDNKNASSSGSINKTDSAVNDKTTPAVNSSVNIITEKPQVSNGMSNSSGDSASVSNKTIVYRLGDFIGKDVVPFHFAKLTGYVVSYRKDSKAEWTNEHVSVNITEYTIRNLTGGTEYTVRVGALYQTNTTMFTTEVKATTQRDPTAKKNCRCNDVGTVGGAKACTFSTSEHPWCKCKPEYSGLFCELCHSGFYRIINTMPCHQCPCSTVASSGHCYFVEGYLHCIGCKDGYVGRMCQHCANGYYRENRPTGSVCLKCHGCHDVGQGLICEPSTGRCINCHYNTAGDRCDKCLPGFTGDPLKNISCTWIAEKHQAGIQKLSSGVIAMICIITILVLSGIVGCIIYRRMRNYPHHRPFWTVELKEGREGVNFSSVPDDDMDRYPDDVKFVEKESKSKSQPYARLQEDI